MTDKELIKQEIERRIDLYSIAEKDDSTFARMGELSSLIDFIDSLPEEPASEDLEEAAENYGIRQGAELKPFAIKFFKAGAKWQKQQMMKGAVEGEVRKGYVDNQIVVSSKDRSANYIAFDASYADAFCVGDKVKIIIAKEEQQ